MFRLSRIHRGSLVRVERNLREDVLRVYAEDKYVFAECVGDAFQWSCRARASLRILRPELEAADFIMLRRGLWINPLFVVRWESVRIKPNTYGMEAILGDGRRIKVSRHGIVRVHRWVKRHGRSKDITRLRKGADSVVGVDP